MLVKTNMKFHRGCMVEVLSKKKDLLGVWRCAQIVEDNEDGYTVRYYRSFGIPKEGVDKVAKEAVRPRPPSGSAVWAVGDVVEVLDDGCWRVSMIEEVLEDECYFIQVIGSVDEFRVKKSSIRRRQEWKENQWVPLEKDSGIDEKLMSRMHKIAQMQNQGSFDMEARDSILLSKKLKRSSLGNLSTDEASQKFVDKRRAVDKQVEHHVVSDAFSFIGKVDTSVNLITGTQRKDKVQNCQNTSNCENHLARVSECDVCVSSRSSVASCCVNLDRLICHSSVSCSQEDNSLYSDAESPDCKGDGVEAMEVNQPKQNDPVRMHELELYSYRSTLEALYACGPLNWELEDYLTNLRQKYCVSNDEHLTELKRLRSIRGSGLSCY